MKKNLFYWIISFLIIGLIICLPFTFTKNNIAMVSDNQYLIPYIISKILYGSLFIISIIFTYKNPIGTGNNYLFYSSAIFIQLFPALCRCAPLMSSFQLGYEIIITTIPLTGYCLFVGLLIKSNVKQIKSIKDYQADSISVQDQTEIEKRNLR